MARTQEAGSIGRHAEATIANRDEERLDTKRVGRHINLASGEIEEGDRKLTLEAPGEAPPPTRIGFKDAFTVRAVRRPRRPQDALHGAEIVNFAVEERHRVVVLRNEGLWQKGETFAGSWMAP